MTRFSLLLVLLAFLLAGCTQTRMEARGYAQGTTYSVIYYNQGQDLQYQIDSLLLSFDRVLSTYQETSYISKWNRNEQVPLEQPQQFKVIDATRRPDEIFLEVIRTLNPLLAERDFQQIILEGTSNSPEI